MLEQGQKKNVQRVRGGPIATCCPTDKSPDGWDILVLVIDAERLSEHRETSGSQDAAAVSILSRSATIATNKNITVDITGV